jgi:hypothetical protein
VGGQGSGVLRGVADQKQNIVIPEWIRACKERRPEEAKAGFAYSGPYTEALLVGNLALRLQKPIEWDSAAMKATNAPEADALIHKTYRDGFGI